MVRNRNKQLNRFVRHAFYAADIGMHHDLREARRKGETETISGCLMGRADYLALAEAARRANVPVYVAATSCIASGAWSLCIAAVTGLSPELVVARPVESERTFTLRVPSHFACEIRSGAAGLGLTTGEFAGWLITNVDAIEADASKRLDAAGY